MVETEVAMDPDPDITVFISDPEWIRIHILQWNGVRIRSESDYSVSNFQQYPCDSNFPNSKCLFLWNLRFRNRIFRSTCFSNRPFVRLLLVLFLACLTTYCWGLSNICLSLHSHITHCDGLEQWFLTRDARNVPRECGIDKHCWLAGAYLGKSIVPCPPSLFFSLGLSVNKKKN